MELYLLNEVFQRTGVVDKYKSLIWTERNSGCSDFVLVVEDTIQNRYILKEGLYLGLDESPETMIIETRIFKKGVIEIKGESLETILKHRMLRKTFYNQIKSWMEYQTPGCLGPTLVHEMCVVGPVGVLDLADAQKEIIPNLALGNYVTPDVLNKPLHSIPYGQLYDAIKTDMDTASYGWGIYLRNVTSTSYQLRFDSWKGLDRTSTQSVNPVVRFEPALDTLTDTSELRSISGYRNVCYAFAPALEMATSPLYGKAVAPGSENFSGYNRRTLYVEVTDLTDEEVNITTAPGLAEAKAALNKRAKDALANNNYVRFVDGTIVAQNAVFKYGLDYKMGDIIELKTSYGTATPARVVEYIRSKDSSGYKEYPTLSLIEE